MPVGTCADVALVFHPEERALDEVATSASEAIERIGMTAAASGGDVDRLERVAQMVSIIRFVRQDVPTRSDGIETR